ncbi:MAG: helix-turn-helix transcriptional regulator [Streptosporangiaceae bacterium]|jgi:AraC-like DNA-binding protein
MPETRQLWPSSPAKSRVLAHGESIPAHHHLDGQLVYAATGVLTVSTAHGSWIAPATRAVWTPPGHEHWHRAYGITDMRILRLPASVAADISARLPGQPVVVAVSPLLREVLLALTTPRAQHLTAKDHLLHVAVAEFVGAPEQPLHLPEPNDDRLSAATNLLHADPANPVTLTQLGRAIGASERTLSRLFHDELGMSFRQWRTQLRLHHALVLLASGQQVSDVAIACGWANPTSLIAAFSLAVGQTPARYQAALKSAG